MEPNTAKGTQTEKSFEVVTSNRKKKTFFKMPSFKKPSKKLAILGAVTAAVLICGGVATYLLTKSDDKPNKTDTTQTQEDPKHMTSLVNANPDASVYGDKNDLQQQLTDAKDDNEKGEIYLKLYYLGVIESEKPETLVSYAAQAEALNPTGRTALITAELAQVANDNKKAAQYYQIFIDRSKTNEVPLSDAEVTSYQDLIKQLEAQA